MRVPWSGSVAPLVEAWIEMFFVYLVRGGILESLLSWKRGLKLMCIRLLLLLIL